MVAETEGLRPVPAQSVFKKWPILALIILGLVIFLLQNRPQSRLEISAHQDKFKVEFDLKEKDRARAEEFLGKFQLPQSVLAGQEFELDSTSAAKLAFASPVALDLNFTENSVTFSGESHIPLIEANLTPLQAFKLPASTYLAVFGRDFGQILKKHFSLPQLDFWIDQNITSEGGQYLTLFTPDANFAISFKAQKPLDTAALEQIAAEVGQDAYKQESADDTLIHLVKSSQKDGATLAIFEMGEWVYATTSLESAKQLIAVQKGDAPFINFPKTSQSVSLVIFFKKTENLNSESISQITTNSQKLTNYLENIREALIMLSGNQISGYVDF